MYLTHSMTRAISHEQTKNYVALDETSAVITVENGDEPRAVEKVADHDNRYELEVLEANDEYAQFEIRFEPSAVQRIAAASEEVGQ